jgi:hypothetical protein
MADAGRGELDQEGAGLEPTMPYHLADRRHEAALACWFKARS